MRCNNTRKHSQFQSLYIFLSLTDQILYIASVELKSSVILHFKLLQLNQAPYSVIVSIKIALNALKEEQGLPCKNLPTLSLFNTLYWPTYSA